MESLQHAMCFSCYKELGSDEEVLMCGKCQVWQHFKCSKDVSASFYSQFYLAVLQDQKPAHWQCQYCVSHDHTLTAAVTPQKHPPPSLADSPHNDQEDELNITFDLNRTGREGPYHATSEGSLDAKVPLRIHKALLKPCPMFGDDIFNSNPTTYSLRQEASGQKVVKDCHGNIFETTGITTDLTESYLCAHAGCQFEVQVANAMGEFLPGGKDLTHNHSMPSSSSTARTTDSSDSNLANPAKRHKPALQSAKHHKSVVQKVEDSSLSDKVILEDQALYTVVDNGTQRGGKKLVSNDGHAFTVKRSSARTTLWRCYVRNKTVFCRATVSEKDGNFTPGAISHCHFPKPGLLKKVQLRGKVASEARAKCLYQQGT